MWGPPGTGKSSVLNAMAAAEGLTVETVIASVREPADFAGLPVVRDDGVHMEPPAWARRLAEAGAGVLFLDELSTAPPAVQAATLRVTLDRVVGDLALPSGVRVVAAANPPSLAADGWDLPAPQANRFLHLDHQVNAEVWADGMTTGFPAPVAGRVHEFDRSRRDASRAEIASFIRHRPELLHQVPSDDTDQGRAWPSHRTWTMTADVLALLDRNDTAATQLAATGLVGTGPAMEFIAWRDTCTLPHPADVIDNPSIVTWPALEPSHALAVLDAVVAFTASKATKVAWNAAWGVLASAAENGCADIATAKARSLMRIRPAGSKPPKAANALAPALIAAGLYAGAAA